VGRILELRSLGDSAEMKIAPPAELERYLVFKGSVSVDGISLTVAEVAPGWFSVALIPHTLAVTNLRGAGPGDPVNLETDVIAKYVERLLGAIDLSAVRR
jgi:riboflavin synthase